MKLPGPVLCELVNQFARKFSIRPDVLACLILQESGGDTAAIRFESGIYQQIAMLPRAKLSGYIPPLLPTTATERIGRAMSWGLMQVLGETARWCAKFQGDYFTEMSNPEIGLEVGCRVLLFYLKKHKGDYRLALDAYNSGSVTDEAGKAYAEKIFKRIENSEHIKYFNG